MFEQFIRQVNGGATYVAKLTVADLQEGDLGKKLTLKVRNEVGSTEYNVALNMLESGELRVLTPQTFNRE